MGHLLFIYAEYCVLQMYLMSDQSFPHPIMGMVHLTNKIEHFGNVTAGKNVDAHVSLSDSYIYHEKGLCFSMTAELFDSKTKKLLWRNESVMLRRMKLTVPESETPFESKIKEADVASLKEIEKWILPSNLGRKYAMSSGDYNPIHLFSFSAKLFGFQQGAIIHGMWTKARALTTIMKNAPKDIDAFRSYDSSRPASSAYVEFKTPLFLPGEVTLLAEKLQCGVHQISNGEREDKVIFQVKGATADMLPHVRGICSWISA